MVNNAMSFEIIGIVLVVRVINASGNNFKIIIIGPTRLVLE